MQCKQGQKSVLGCFGRLDIFADDSNQQKSSLSRPTGRLTKMLMFHHYTNDRCINQYIMFFTESKVIMLSSST